MLSSLHLFKVELSSQDTTLTCAQNKAIYYNQCNGQKLVFWHELISFLLLLQKWSIIWHFEKLLWHQIGQNCCYEAKDGQPTLACEGSNLSPVPMMRDQFFTSAPATWRKRGMYASSHSGQRYYLNMAYSLFIIWEWFY